jgi:hypothetical protein
MGNKRKPNATRKAADEDAMPPTTAAEKAAAAAKEASEALDARDQRMMDHFHKMQEATTKAFNKQSKENSVDAEMRQEALLRELLPKLTAPAPAAPRTMSNNLFTASGSSSHNIPSTGLISAAASGYDAQLPPLGHLTGELSSGSTSNDTGR